MKRTIGIGVLLTAAVTAAGRHVHPGGRAVGVPDDQSADGVGLQLLAPAAHHASPLALVPEPVRAFASLNPLVAPFNQG